MALQGIGNRLGHDFFKDVVLLFVEFYGKFGLFLTVWTKLLVKACWILLASVAKE